MNDIVSSRRRTISSTYLLYVNGKTNVNQRRLFEEKKISPVSRNFFERKKGVSNLKQLKHHHIRHELTNINWYQPGYSFVNISL